MKNGMSTKPASRAGKSQISAFVKLELGQAAHKYCSSKQLTIQEILAMAINTAVAHYGHTKPFLDVTRDRFVNRKKSIAKKQEKLSGIRKDKMRLAGWFENNDVESVKTYAKSVGKRVEGLVEKGLTKLLGFETLIETVPEPASVETWDWSKIETAKLPKINKERRSKQAA